jgi:hypothetical protein
MLAVPVDAAARVVGGGGLGVSRSPAPHGLDVARGAPRAQTVFHASVAAELIGRLSLAAPSAGLHAITGTERCFLEGAPPDSLAIRISLPDSSFLTDSGFPQFFSPVTGRRWAADCLLKNGVPLDCAIVS